MSLSHPLFAGRSGQAVSTTRLSATEKEVDVMAAGRHKTTIRASLTHTTAAVGSEQAITCQRKHQSP